MRFQMFSSNLFRYITFRRIIDLSPGLKTKRDKIMYDEYLFRILFRITIACLLVTVESTEKNIFRLLLSHPEHRPRPSELRI
jgi:hypothetical protein